VPAKARRPSEVTPDPVQRWSASLPASVFRTTQVEEKRPAGRPAVSCRIPVALSTWPGFRPRGPAWPDCRISASRTMTCLLALAGADRAPAAETAASTTSVTTTRIATVLRNLTSPHPLGQRGGRGDELVLRDGRRAQAVGDTGEIHVAAGAEDDIALDCRSAPEGESVGAGDARDRERAEAAGAASGCRDLTLGLGARAGLRAELGDGRLGLRAETRGVERLGQPGDEAVPLQ